MRRSNHRTPDQPIDPTIGPIWSTTIRMAGKCTIFDASTSLSYHGVCFPLDNEFSRLRHHFPSDNNTHDGVLRWSWDFDALIVLKVVFSV